MYKIKMKFLISVIILITGSGNCTPCSDIESLDISSGVKHTNGSVTHGGIEYEAGSWYEVVGNGNETVTYGCPCIQRKCVWKCCGPEMMYFNKTCTATTRSEVNPFIPPVYNDTLLAPDIEAHQMFFYMYNQLCMRDRYRVTSDLNGIYLQQNGNLLIVDAIGVSATHSPAHFCLEMMGVDTGDALQNVQLTALVCIDVDGSKPPENREVLYWYGYGMAILSVPFLIITFLVYACIPELRNVHGKCLLGYCGGLIVAYSILIHLKLSSYEFGTYMTPCIIMAIIMYYSFQTSFFWLNVMCFDIWRTFRGYRNANKKRETRRFIAYGLYAWGVPLLLTIFTIVMQFTENLPDYLVRPRYGLLSCWFPDWTTQMLYFYIPVLILVACNILFFSITAYRIQSIRKETAILRTSESARNDRLNKDKQRYMLYVNLFVVMGVNWTIELISFFTGGNDWFWLVVDISNISIGLAIFLISVWKNKAKTLVQRKWATWRGTDGPTLTDFSTGRYATRSSTAPTELTRITGPSDKSA